MYSNTLSSQAKNNNGNNVPSPDHTETNESGDSEQESDNFTRLAFDKIIPDDSTANNKHISEGKKK